MVSYWIVFYISLTTIGYPPNSLIDILCKCLKPEVSPTDDSLSTCYNDFTVSRKIAVYCSSISYCHECKQVRSSSNNNLSCYFYSSFVLCTFWGSSKIQVFKQPSYRCILSLEMQFQRMGKNQNRKYVEKYGLPADLLDNMLKLSEDAWSPKIALKIQEEIGVVKKIYCLTVLIT